MRRTLQSLSLVVFMALVLGACTTLTGKSLGENIDDASITAAVKTKLAEEKISTLTRIDVDTNRASSI